MPDINQERDNQDSAYTLLAVLLKYAPDDAAQAKTSRLYNEAQYHGAFGRSLALTVAGWICDGLRYGNWPWNSPDGQVGEVTAVWMTHDEANKG